MNTPPILFGLLFLIFSVVLPAQNRLNLPLPNAETHPYDYARYLDNEVTPLKDKLDEFFTIYASGNSDRLKFITELINSEAKSLFNTLRSLPQREGDVQVREAYLDFAQFAMNSKGIFAQVAQEAPTFPGTDRNPDLLSPKARDAYNAALRLRKGYVTRVQSLLKAHNAFADAHAEEFANYPASKILDVLNSMKKGSFPREVVYLEFLASPETYERGTRYFFSIDRGMLAKGQAFQDQFDALIENISNALQALGSDWKLEPWEETSDRMVVMMPANYAYPRPPLAVIRLNLESGENKGALSLELYSQVPSFLKR